MADLLTFLGSAEIGRGYEGKAKVSVEVDLKFVKKKVKKTVTLCDVHFLTAEANKVIVRCDLRAGASALMGLGLGGSNHITFDMRKRANGEFQFGKSGINDPSEMFFYWNWNEAGGSLVLTPGGGADTAGFPTLTVTPEGESTKIVRTGGDAAYTLVDEVIIEAD
jgi:hypothetical protein